MQRTGRGRRGQRTEDRTWAWRTEDRTQAQRTEDRTQGAEHEGTPSTETESGTEPQGEPWFPENRCGLGLKALSQVGEAKSLLLSVDR